MCRRCLSQLFTFHCYFNGVYVDYGLYIFWIFWDHLEHLTHSDALKSRFIMSPSVKYHFQWSLTFFASHHASLGVISSVWIFMISVRCHVITCEESFELSPSLCKREWMAQVVFYIISDWFHMIKREESAVHPVSFSGGVLQVACARVVWVKSWWHLVQIHYKYEAKSVRWRSWQTTCISPTELSSLGEKWCEAFFSRRQVSEIRPSSSSTARALGNQIS